MRYSVSISGDLRKIIAEETVLAAQALRRGVERAGRGVQGELREQVRAAGFRGGGERLANAWRMKVYPPTPKFTLHPAALVYATDKGRANAANIFDAFDKGVPIRARGKKWLAWPTGFNATGGRRQAGFRGGMRVTLAEMAADKKDTVVLNARGRRDVALWCLRVREGRGRRGKFGPFNKTRVRLYVGGKNVEVATGKIKAAERNVLVRRLLDRGYVAMFFLAKQVNPRKRLDVAGAAARAEAVLDSSLRAELART